MRPFELLKPESIGECCSLLAEHGDRAKLIAGGTDLLIFLKKRLLRPSHVISMSRIPGLDEIREVQNCIHIGPLATFRAIETSEKMRRTVPVVADGAHQVGSVAIRNVATLGGNLCNAAPSADGAPPLLALDARVGVAGPVTSRIIPLDQFFRGPGETALERGEVLTGIDIPIPLSGSRAVYLKVRRTATDIALVGVAVLLVVDPEHRRAGHVRIALGAVAPTPMRSRRAEDCAEGMSIDGDRGWVEEVARAAAEEAQPISDHRASVEYRRAMVAFLVREAMHRLIEDKPNCEGGPA